MSARSAGLRRPTACPTLASTLLAACAATLLAACTFGEPTRPEAVLLVSLDTLRADRLGAYGYERPTSPAIDALAAEGTLFTHASASSPWTVPSHLSLVTGLYPHAHGVVREGLRLPEDVPTLAEILQEEGFRTRAVVSSMHLTAKTGFARGFDRLDYVPEWDLADPARRRLRNPGAEVTALALEALDELRGTPFLLFLHYYDAHSDYSPLPRFRAGLVDAYGGRADGSTQQLVAVRARRLRLGEQAARHFSQLYDAEIRQLDAQIERLLGHLEEAGMADSTLVVLTSDHGEELWEHGSVLHGRTYFEEVVRIPLILRGPGVPAGLRIDALASLVDVTPTLLGLLGRPVPERLQGVDLSGYWAGHPPQRDGVLAEADRGHARPGRFRMLRTERYKLVDEPRTGLSRLYDLEADPREQHPLAAPELARTLRDRLDEVAGPPRAAPEAPGISEEERELLRRLGYADEGTGPGGPPAR